MPAICAGLVYNSPSEGYGFAEAVLPADPAEPLVWQPLIPVGDFEHPDFGPFTVTYEDLAAMEGNFRAGLPVGKGIPIDEDGLHELRGGGAFGWIKDVRIQDGWLEGGIEWTPAGMAAVGSGELPYVSAHFFPQGCEAPAPWGRDNFVLSVALCTRPFFNNQPELRVAATSYKRVGPGVRATQHDNEVKATMAQENDLQARLDEALGKVTTLAEQLATLTTERDGLKASLDTVTEERDGLKASVDALTEERDGLKASVATLTEQCDGYKLSIENLESRMGEMEEATALAAAEKDIAATALAKGQQLAPAAIGLMATAKVKPTPENLRALQDHLMENGGALLTVPLPEKDKGLTATAPISDEAMTDEEWLAAKPITEAAKVRIRQIMQSKSIKASVAYREYLRAKS